MQALRYVRDALARAGYLPIVTGGPLDRLMENEAAARLGRNLSRECTMPAAGRRQMQRCRRPVTSTLGARKVNGQRGSPRIVSPRWT